MSILDRGKDSINQTCHKNAEHTESLKMKFNSTKYGTRKCNYFEYKTGLNSLNN